MTHDYNAIRCKPKIQPKGVAVLFEMHREFELNRVSLHLYFVWNESIIIRANTRPASTLWYDANHTVDYRELKVEKVECVTIFQSILAASVSVYVMSTANSYIFYLEMAIWKHLIFSIRRISMKCNKTKNSKQKKNRK